MLKLRNYQVRMLNSVLARLDDQERVEDNAPLLVVSPTGSGKGRVIASLALTLSDAGSDVLILTPRRRLLIQTLNQFNNSSTGVMCSNIGDDAFGDDVNVIVATWQTAIKRILNQPHPPKYCIIDEAHLLPIFDAESEYALCIEALREIGVCVIGFTATAYRGQLSIIADGYWRLVCEIPILELIEAGYLVPPRAIASGAVQMVDSENIESVTQAIIPHLLASLTKHGFQKTLIFALDINHARYIYELLMGLVAESLLVGLVHSEMSQQDIDAVIDAFDNYDGSAILINVSIISIGVDLPCVDSIGILRNISNGSTYTQIVGRGLRPFSNKTECGIFDFGCGTERFGELTNPSLRGRKGKKAVRLKACPECQSLNTVVARSCYYCSFKFSFQVGINTVSMEKNLLGADVQFVTVSALSKKDGFGICYLKENNRYIYDTKQQYQVGDRLLVKDVTDKVVKVIAQI